MMKFTILVIASVLAPGFAAIPQTRPALVGIATLPAVIDLDLDDLTPHPMPEVQPLPESVDANPCNVCFEYMTSLIDQLTVESVNPVLPELPSVEEEEVEGNTPVRPLPEALPEDLRPLPVPEGPGIEISPIPIPVAPEIEIRPLPLPVAPEVEIQPIPMPIVQVIRV